MLWIGGFGALDTKGVPRSGSVLFDETCQYPGAPLNGALDGPAVIDGEGELWAQGPGGKLYVWTPEQLRQSCSSQAPSRTLSLPAMTALAFDAEGNLWGNAGYQLIGDTGRIAIFGYRASDLEEDGAPTPAWALTGPSTEFRTVQSPAGLAFDSRDYLWVGDAFALLAFSPETRTGPNDGGPDGTGPLADFYITDLCDPFCCDCAPSCYGTICEGPGYFDLAFDANGNLWASTRYPSASDIVAYSRSELENAAINVHPPASAYFRIARYEGAGPIAFDQDGKLWVGFLDPDEGVPTLYRYSVASLPMDGGSPSDNFQPDLAVTVPSNPAASLAFNVAASLAFSPIPSGLPIQPR